MRIDRPILRGVHGWRRFFMKGWLNLLDRRLLVGLFVSNLVGDILVINFVAQLVVWLVLILAATLILFKPFIVRRQANLQANLVVVFNHGGEGVVSFLRNLGKQSAKLQRLCV